VIILTNDVNLKHRNN